MPVGFVEPVVVVLGVSPEMVEPVLPVVEPVSAVPTVVPEVASAAVVADEA